MSEREAFDGLKSIIERMVTDEEFKQAILENPEETINEAGYQVSAEEMLALKNLTAEDVEGLTPELLDERLSKSAMGVDGYTVYTTNIQGAAAQ